MAREPAYAAPMRTNEVAIHQLVGGYTQIERLNKRLRIKIGRTQKKHASEVVH
jgi:hypothetical protein